MFTIQTYYGRIEKILENDIKTERIKKGQILKTKHFFFTIRKSDIDNGSEIQELHRILWTS